MEDHSSDGIVVAYVNTEAEVKADRWRAAPDAEILFLPDRLLGSYVERVTRRRMQLWPGECCVHAAIRSEDVTDLRAQHPDADLLLHPESGRIDTYLSEPPTANWLPGGPSC